MDETINHGYAKQRQGLTLHHNICFLLNPYILLKDVTFQQSDTGRELRARQQGMDPKADDAGQQEKFRGLLQRQTYISFLACPNRRSIESTGQQE